MMCLAEVTFAGDYSSLHIFGDSLSTTTDNTSGGTNYFGNRYSNGRVWVDVLAERQELNYNFNYNLSAFGNYSSSLLTTVSNYPAPPDVSTALYVVWVSAGDLFSYALAVPDTNQWLAAIARSMTNYTRVIQMLYNDGVRTLVMPNVVDISAAPFFASASAGALAFFRRQAIAFNLALAQMIDSTQAMLPGLTIYVPDLFSQFDDLLAHPARYGLINPGIDALDDPALADKSLNGPGADYLFWDPLHPAAKVHELMADLVQQVISPVCISNLTLLSNSNRLQVANIPLGRDGIVESSSNLVNWVSAANVIATNATQTILVSHTGAEEFYRLKF